MPTGQAQGEGVVRDGVGGATGPVPEVCPYCGGEHRGGNRCELCAGFVDPLSRQATQNEMGPWFVRDESRPFRPGCRLETLERWVRGGRITPDTIIRGPSTHQNWLPAVRVPGVARLFGLCHACGGEVDPTDTICAVCGAGLETTRDRQHLGLSPVRAIPGRADPEQVAISLIGPRTNGSPSSAANAPSPAPAPPMPPLDDAARRARRLERELRASARRANIAWCLAAALAFLSGMILMLHRASPERAHPEREMPAGETGAP
jgi:hypothetical protein